MIGKRLNELLAMRGQEALYGTTDAESLAELRQSAWSAIERLGGESLAELQQRAWSTIQRLVNRYHDGVIVVVSHYFVILTIICAVLNLPVSQMGRLRLNAGSISTVVFDEQVTRLVLFNDSCHLMAQSYRLP